MAVLLTGGTGYIGSHTALALLRAGRDVVVMDNLSNSSPEAIRRVGELAGREPVFVEADVRDGIALDKIFADNDIDATIHFAGLKAVGESVADPLAYYDNNIASTVALAHAMDAAGVRDLVFSSSATVYGATGGPEFTETMPLAPGNPYGRTKVMIEQILRDLAVTGDGWRVSLLRYFNPVGADPSGRIGEDPRGVPANLLPFLAQVAVGRRPELVVFGDDYDTPDGTGVRDYIHVSDLAAGHLAALEAMPAAGSARAYNLGVGKGSSVLEVVRAFEAASGRRIPYRTAGRRPGDAAACWANPARANAALHWHAERTLLDACADTWRWQSANPDGYS